ncbi:MULTISPECIES: ATP-binding cassette domain-containing protein [Burkholderia]|uniref:ATP-binding cassette domain-containing protein n=1 Tax=Burkholderia TaxID=32008 RepID=UPI00005313D7|nr:MULTISPECIES: ATP-binding cassette domain-containing protein [Burkholderia]MDS0806586.1 ATP-binding cassette domain-containing protein [Burkholderia cenocepacia]
MPDGVLPYGEQTVGTVLGFYRETFRASVSRLHDVVRQLALDEMLARRGTTLSKGYRRRLLLAIGMLSPQPLLCLDEPFDGLDLRQTQAVMALLRDEVRAGRALLVAIHQLVDAERLCDRLLLLSGGRVLGEGTLETLRELAGVDGCGLEEVFLALT